MMKNERKHEMATAARQAAYRRLDTLRQYDAETWKSMTSFLDAHPHTTATEADRAEARRRALAWRHAADVLADYESTLIDDARA